MVALVQFAQKQILQQIFEGFQLIHSSSHNPEKSKYKKHSNKNIQTISL